MSLEKLKELANNSDNEELKTTVEDVISAHNANLDKLAALEVDRNKAIEKRDATRSLVKNTLGVDELTEDNLKAAINNLRENADESLKAEVTSLSTLAQQREQEVQTIKGQLQQMKQRYAIEQRLNKLGASSEVDGSRAYDLLVEEVTKGATMSDDGSVKFFNPDGSTMRNPDGSETTLEDRYSQLKSNDELRFLFKTSRSKRGSGFNGTGAGETLTTLKGLDDKQRVALYKQNPELFKKLSEQDKLKG